MLAREVDAAADKAAREHLKDLQRTVAPWFHVEYALHGRMFIAYHQGRDCPPGGLILRAAVPGQLLMLMDRVAPPHWRMSSFPLLSARPKAVRHV
ncbi:hypothetical protein [Nonomuraea jabiensis]|uniref:hypothetical protein n=1 Tax=Nonomuraea jabiensis TaxID=882448 RepID=UPI003D708E14